jgi:hypothetical protein
MLVASAREWIIPQERAVDLLAGHSASGGPVPTGESSAREPGGVEISKHPAGHRLMLAAVSVTRFHFRIDRRL